MKKLYFLVGEWSGEVRLRSSPTEICELNQTENAYYKLDGLVLVIEGTGWNKSDGTTSSHAFAVISYDDATSVYRMRAYNDGRYLETDLKLTDDGKGFTWAFLFGQIKTNYLLRINEEGEWTETGDVIVGEQSPQRFWELAVRPKK